MSLGRATLRLIALLGVVTLACSNGGESDPTSGPAARRLPLELLDIAFAPARLEVAVDEEVELTLSNTGTIEHDFTIEGIEAEVRAPGSAGAHEAHNAGYDVHASVPAREASTLRLRVNQPGEYTFFCTVLGHREAGMHGTLVAR